MLLKVFTQENMRESVLWNEMINSYQYFSTFTSKSSYISTGEKKIHFDIHQQKKYFYFNENKYTIYFMKGKYDGPDLFNILNTRF